MEKLPESVEKVGVFVDESDRSDSSTSSIGAGTDGGATALLTSARMRCDADLRRRRVQ